MHIFNVRKCHGGGHTGYGGGHTGYGGGLDELPALVISPFLLLCEDVPALRSFATLSPCSPFC